MKRKQTLRFSRLTPPLLVEHFDITVYCPLLALPITTRTFDLATGTSSISIPPNPPRIGTLSFVQNPLVLPTNGPRSMSFPLRIRPLVAYV